MRSNFLTLLLLLQAVSSCTGQARTDSETEAIVLEQKSISDSNSAPLPFDTTYRSIHIFVALCDNKYQGIVPVPAKIGNGQDPHNNLYWGCGYGIRTYFKKSREWTLLRSQKLDTLRLERLVFKHADKNFYLIADAYDGKFIKDCTQDFLRSSCGQQKDTIMLGERSIGIGGNADLLAYIGHDGLMDFELPETYVNNDNKQRDVIILACYSKHYFTPYLRQANVDPLVWTSGLMAPEAYTIHDALTGYVRNETNDSIRSRAALAYAKFQKCSEKAARNLLVMGW